MAITNSICLTQTGCNKIIITDTSDWDTIVPLVDITSTVVDIVHNEITTTVTENEYLDEIEITALLLGFTTKLEDGEYDIKVTYTTEEDTYVIEEETFIICNIQCIIDNIVADVSITNCQDCEKEKKSTAIDATFMLDALEASIACGNLTKSQVILDWLNDLLINYNCKNC